jgi:hypothetical protein
MRGADLAEAMASMVDRIVSAREGAGALDKVIEAVIGTIGWFSGKDATSYLEAYRAEMVMRDILEHRRLAGFPRVAMPSIHAKVLEVRAESQTWEEFGGRLLERYEIVDALRLSKRDFMEAYRAEMVMRDILEHRRLAGFPRVAMPSIHAVVVFRALQLRMCDSGW